MNNLIQLIVILLGLLLIQQLFSKNLSKPLIPFLQKNVEEDKTMKAIDLLPIPATILASQNPNVIKTNEVKIL